MKILLILNKSKKRKKKNKGSDITDYEPPIYVVQPAEGDTGFAYVKKEFDKMKTQYTPKVAFSYADQS